jgi:Tfp pilus assembly protein PilX
MGLFQQPAQPRGAALVIAMLLMAVLLMAGTSFLTISSTETQIAKNAQASAEAFSLAEAAVHKAIAQLNANSGYTGEANTAFSGGTFTVTVTSAAGCAGSTSARTLLATGYTSVTGGTAQAQIAVTLDQVTYPFGWGTYSTVPNGIVASQYNYVTSTTQNRTDKEVWLGGTSVTDSFDSGAGAYGVSGNTGRGGNIGANGDVTVDANSVINGNITAGDDIILDGRTVPGDAGARVTVSGTKLSKMPAKPFPAIAGPSSTSGDVSITGTQTLAPGTYYFNTLYLGSGATLTSSGAVTIYVKYWIWTESNATIGASPGTDMTIVGKSDGSVSSDNTVFRAGDNFRFYGSMYGYNTDIQLGTNAQIFGSMIGRTFYARSGISLHYNQALMNRPICQGGNRFNIVRGTWREVIPAF